LKTLLKGKKINQDEMEIKEKSENVKQGKEECFDISISPTFYEQFLQQ